MRPTPLLLGLLSSLAFASLPAQTPAVSSDFTLVLTGDSIINRRLSLFSAPGFDDMIKTIRDADVAFTNFETLIHDFAIPGASQSGGTYMGSPKFVTDELEWAGFDLVSTATNHSNDYGIAGLEQTLVALQNSKLVFAGSGPNLARARSPGYLDSRKGRVALISAASTFSPASPAGPQRKDMPGRTGLNPLRFTTTYTVDGKALETLRHYAGPTGDKKAADGTRYVNFLNANFVAGDQPGVTTKCDAGDLAEITATIKDARQQADWVIMSVHCHENPGHDQRELPPQFFVEFCHAAIDAGADVVVGHGPHFLKGVEVYKGKPILYSLGNFIFENDLVEFQPAENYDRQDLPPGALPSDFYTKRSRGDTTSFPADRPMWDGAFAELVFAQDRSLKAITFHPITLDFGKPRTKRGQPHPAEPPHAQQIIEHLRDLSAPMGTTIAFENGVGVLRLK